MAEIFKGNEVWSAIESIMSHTPRMLLYGPSGTGKTHAATLSSLREKEKIFQITLTPDTPAAALIGHFILKGNKCVWLDGVGIAAWKAAKTGPTRLVINEVDHAGPDAISAMHLLLDDRSTAGISLPSEEYVDPGEHLRIIGTMNGVPEDLLPSLQDRFTVRIAVNSVHPKAVEILPENMRKPAVNMAINTDPARRVSIRAWHAYAELSKHVPVELAAKCVFGNKWSEVVDGLRVSSVK